MKVVNLEKLVLNLELDGDNVILKYADTKIMLLSQTLENTSAILEENFYMVYNFYKSKITNFPFEMTNDTEDLAYISLKIVVHYLYMYNLWRIQYKKSKAYENLDFKDKDFSNPSTNDIIINFYKSKRPDTWKLMCIQLLGFTAEEFDSYYREREHFYNK